MSNENPGRAEIVAAMARELDLQCRYDASESWRLWVEHWSSGWTARMEISTSEAGTVWTISRSIPESMGRVNGLSKMIRQIVEESFAKLRAGVDPA